MSCTYRHLAQRIAPIIGIPPELLMTMTDRIIWGNHPSAPPCPLTLRPEVVEAVARTLPDGHQPEELQRSFGVVLSSIWSLVHSNQHDLLFRHDDRRMRLVALLHACSTDADKLPIPTVSPALIADIRKEITEPSEPSHPIVQRALRLLHRGQPVPWNQPPFQNLLNGPDSVALVPLICSGTLDWTVLPTPLSPHLAAHLLAAGISAPALRQAIESSPIALAIAGSRHHELLTPEHITRIAANARAVAILAKSNAFVDPLLAAAEPFPRSLASLLAIHPDRITDQRLRVVAQDKQAVMRLVMDGRTDPVLIESIDNDPILLALAIAHHPHLATDERINRILADSGACATFADSITNCPDVTPLVLAAARRSPDLAYFVVYRHDAYQEDPTLLAAIAQSSSHAVRAASDTAPYARHPIILRAIAQTGSSLIMALRQIPDLRISAAFAAELATTPPQQIHAAIHHLGPLPVLWTALPDPERQRVIRRYRLSPDLVAWITDLSQRAERQLPLWTIEDRRIARQIRRRWAERFEAFMGIFLRESL